jgi:hypothetical protein
MGSTNLLEDWGNPLAREYATPAGIRLFGDPLIVTVENTEQITTICKPVHTGSVLY